MPSESDEQLPGVWHCNNQLSSSMLFSEYWLQCSNDVYVTVSSTMALLFFCRNTTKAGARSALRTSCFTQLEGGCLVDASNVSTQDWVCLSYFPVKERLLWLALCRATPFFLLGDRTQSGKCCVIARLAALVMSPVLGGPKDAKVRGTYLHTAGHSALLRASHGDLKGTPVDAGPR